ncbi:MAG: murein transglycosylase A [Rhodospirillaceae bacterium]
MIDAAAIAARWRPAARLAAAAALISTVSACAGFPGLPAPKPGAEPGGAETLSLVAKPYEELPGWKADSHAEVLPVLLRSCARFESQPPETRVGTLDVMGKVKDWLPVCADAKRVRAGNDTDARYFFESRFQPYLALGGADSVGLFTGYYEPELRGSWKPDARYRVPIYSLPPDVVSADLGQFDDKWRGEQIAGRLVDGRFVPYFDRAAIEDGALSGRQLEILWVDDPIDAFFLHIQGSGRIMLPDGTFIRLGYGGRNGQRYTAVGRELVAAGIMRLQNVTMPAIRQWMIANPVAGQALMRKNRSFVFFKVLKTEGPIGAEGTQLTPLRSLAVDRRFIPLGAPVWLVTTDPGVRPAKPLRRLVMAQDTGSAIKGPVRGDLFWGYGAAAGDKAGIMKERGRYFLLLPRSLAPQPGS